MLGIPSAGINLKENFSFNLISYFVFIVTIEKKNQKTWSNIQYIFNKINNA